MERAELERFKNTLLDRLHAIEEPLGRREEIAVENTPDAIDAVQNAAERQLAISQLESDSNRLQSIKFALERVADGSYGTCLRCDTEISAKRLNAVPWASHCIKCQDILDDERQGLADRELLPFV
jgi:DnaK suppressor protein